MVVGILPLASFISLNLPLVLDRIEESVDDNQAAQLQHDYLVLQHVMERRRESLQAFCLNQGVIEIASGVETELSTRIMRKRIFNMLYNWYNSKTDVLSIKIADHSGQVQVNIQRNNHGELYLLAETKKSSIRKSEWFKQIKLYSAGEVFMAGAPFFQPKNENRTEASRTTIQLGTYVKSDNGKPGGIGLIKFDLSRFLPAANDQFLLYDGHILPLAERGNSTNHSEKLYSEVLNDLSHLRQQLHAGQPCFIDYENGKNAALIPLFNDIHKLNYLWLGYPVTSGEIGVWLQKFRIRFIIVFIIFFLAIMLLSIKIASGVEQVSKDLVKGLSGLLQDRKKITLPWKYPRELQDLSHELSHLSDEYLASLNARRKAEKENKKILEQLQQSQKMEAIGLLAGGVAHDLNNILSGIVSYPELILLQLPEESELRTKITAIKESGERAADIVADLLTVTRGIASPRTTVNLNDLIDKFRQSPEYLEIKQSHNDIEFSFELEKNLPNIFCSAVHVHKCLMNLTLNGVEAISGPGHIKIVTLNKTVDASFATKYEIEGGKYAVVEIGDSGSGIAEKDLSHIFDPFYTKKEMGRKSGTGLGLTVVWNTLREHKGTVTVSSNKRGSIFRLYFPVITGDLTALPPIGSTEEFRGGSELILVVDDELLQQDIACKILSTLGYRVKAVSSGEKALDFLQEHKPSLILLDMIMAPGMNGRETYEKILALYPGQKAVIASGFSLDDEVKKTLKLGAGSYIKKPYSMAELSIAVYRELHRKSKT